MRALKEIPNFQHEAEERAFWARHDSTEFIAWDAAESASLPKLKPRMKTVSMEETRERHLC
ncbi:MAG: CopG family antitoxin [candidate division KSB1 bacterium]